eukprot:scaffold294_cov281-Pinguiococcus_pyrenoidosus.AAC.8
MNSFVFIKELTPNSAPQLKASPPFHPSRPPARSASPRRRPAKLHRPGLRSLRRQARRVAHRQRGVPRHPAALAFLGWRRPRRLPSAPEGTGTRACRPQAA